MKRPDSPAPLTPQELKFALKRLKWTQTELAGRTGLTVQTISKWATGQAPIAPWAREYLWAMLAIADLRDRFLAPQFKSKTE